jgi:alpha-ribazole phosphatase
MRLWLLRHPEPEESARGRCYGSLDVGLSARGIAQAHAVAAALAVERIEAIYSSPRRRCREAAGILAKEHGIPVETVEPLREIDFGDFEGRSYDEIAARYPELYRQWMEHPTELQFPGGESFRDMRARVLAAAGNLRARHAGQTVALVTHGGVIRVLLADALGVAPERLFRIAQRHAGISLIRWVEEIPMVEMVNSEAWPESRFYKGSDS